MKRDLDLCRRILLTIESSDEDPRDGVELGFIDEYPKNVVSEHVRLLAEEGLIEAYALMAFGPDGYVWMPKRLTMAGHELLNVSRNEETWRKGKRLLEHAGSASLTLLKEVLLELARRGLTL